MKKERLFREFDNLINFVPIAFQLNNFGAASIESPWLALALC